MIHCMDDVKFIIEKFPSFSKDFIDNLFYSSLSIVVIILYIYKYLNIKKIKNVKISLFSLFFRFLQKKTSKYICF